MCFLIRTELGLSRCSCSPNSRIGQGEQILTVTEANLENSCSFLPLSLIHVLVPPEPILKPGALFNPSSPLAQQVDSVMAPIGQKSTLRAREATATRALRSQLKRILWFRCPAIVLPPHPPPPRLRCPSLSRPLSSEGRPRDLGLRQVGGCPLTSPSDGHCLAAQGFKKNTGFHIKTLTFAFLQEADRTHWGAPHAPGHCRQGCHGAVPVPFIECAPLLRPGSSS